MRFRSDKQRRAMFAAINGINSFSNKNVSNKFALYIDDEFPSYYIRSTKYPGVNVSTTDVDNRMRDLIKSLDEKDERNLAGVSYLYIREDPTRKNAGIYYLPAKSIDIYDYYVDQYEDYSTDFPDDADRMELEEERTKDFRDTLRHELIHHIDPGLENIVASDAIRDKAEILAYNTFDDDSTDSVEFINSFDVRSGRGKMGRLKKKADDADTLDRYYFADKLKDLSTPTFKELEEYAK